MSEKELVEQLKQIVLHAEQEAMKQSLNAKAEHKLEIEAKADGVMELCKAMRKVIADYDDSVKPKEDSNRGLLSTKPLPEKPSKNCNSYRLKINDMFDGSLKTSIIF